MSKHPILIPLTVLAAGILTIAAYTLLAASDFTKIGKEGDIGGGLILLFGMVLSAAGIVGSVVVALLRWFESRW